MAEHKEAGKAAQRARDSMRDVPELRHDPDYRDFLREVIGDVQKTLLAKNEEGKVVSTSGSLGDDLTAVHDAFLASIDKTIEEASNSETSSEDDILAILPAAKEELKKVVGEALRVHLIGFYRANRKSLGGTIFDPNLDPRSEQARTRRDYIHEFVANVITLQSLAGGKGDAKVAKKLAIRFSPNFAKEYFYGDYIKRHLAAEGLVWTDEEIDEVFTPGVRRHIAFINPADIDAALKRAAENIRKLDNTYIKERLDMTWTDKEIGEVFTPGVRRHFAVHNAADIDTVLKRTAENVRVFEKMLEKLPEENRVAVAEIPTMVRNHLCTMYENPQPALLKWLRGEIQIGTYTAPKKV